MLASNFCYIHLLPNISEEHLLQNKQFLHPSAISADAFNVLLQLYNHQGVKRATEAYHISNF